MAMVGTAVIVVCLILYASSTERDFTGYYPYLWVFCLSLCLFGIFCIWSPFTYAIYSALAIFLFSAYIVCDTQLIVGGKGRAELGVDDYVFGALVLYLDIINLFLYLLSFLSATSNRDCGVCYYQTNKQTIKPLNYSFFFMISIVLN